MQEKKTEMCRNIVEKGYCKYGDACWYAHSPSELRPRRILSPREKTQLCRHFHEKCYCCFGNRCRFIHGTGNRRLPVFVSFCNRKL